jgi:hypothetical protein
MSRLNNVYLNSISDDPRTVAVFRAVEGDHGDDGLALKTRQVTAVGHVLEGYSFRGK